MSDSAGRVNFQNRRPERSGSVPSEGRAAAEFVTLGGRPVPQCRHPAFSIDSHVDLATVSVLCLTLRRRLWNAFVRSFFVLSQRSLPYAHRARLVAMRPRCRFSIQINESFLVWFASWFNLFCVVPRSLQIFPPLHSNSLRASMRGWEGTWLRFLPKIALIFLNDCTRRISQLYRDGDFFKNIYQFYTHPTGWFREALWCYLIDTAGPGILQPLCSSFVSHAYWEKK